MRGYLRRVLIAIDQAFNVIFLNGFPDETASSHWARERKHKDKAADIACEVLDVLDKDHCATSIEENPDGSTAARHMGRVIRELPPDEQKPRLVKVPQDRLHKLRAAGFVILSALWLMGCPIQIIVKPQPSPEPEASPTPAPTPSATPEPTPSRTPEPSAPPASPVPSPSTAPSGAPPLDATGNYPIPPDGVCPPWFKDSLARVGIQEHARRSCGQCVKDGYLGVIITASATPKSAAPYCGHASDRRECEQWRPCQDGYTDWTNPNLGPDLLMTLPGHWTDARCDKRSDNNYLCHHKPRREEVGVMTFKACPRGARPDDQRCGVSRPVRVQ